MISPEPAQCNVHIGSSGPQYATSSLDTTLLSEKSEIEHIPILENIRQKTLSASVVPSIHPVLKKNPTVEIIPTFRTMSLDIKYGTKKASKKQDFKNVNIHTLRIDQILAQLGAFSISQGGLPEDVAASKLKKNGPNSITPPRDSYILKILSFIFGGFCFLMWISAIIMFLTYYPLPQINNQAPQVYNLAVTILLLVVIFIQAAFYAWQDWSSSSVMSKINNLLAAEAQVIRAGKSVTIPSKNVVVGDIIELKLGTKIPCDCVFFECASDLSVDRAILTGESVPVSASTHATESSFMESKNVGLMGTLIVNGSGRAVAVFTGDNTVMGKIATLSGKKKTERTLLQKEVDVFVAFVASIAIGCGVICLLVWKFYLMKLPKPQYNLIGMLGNVCGIIVAFVPEGLPISMSVTLTLIARRMAKQFVLVKNLTTIETLGAVSIICTDKTGTLTQNVMTLHITEIGNQDFSNASSNAKKMFHLVASQCCGADFAIKNDSTPLMDRKVTGDATDKAVLRFAESLGSVDLVRKSFDKIFEIPFNSRNKWMLTIQKSFENALLFGGSETTLFIKGAPDFLYPKITNILNADGTISPFDATAAACVVKKQLEWSKQGRRVLAFAYRVLKDEFASIDSDFETTAIAVVNNLTLIGLGAIVDPPRPEIKETICKCKIAHIRVAMVTGDFAVTGQAIAREIGIITAEKVDTVTEMRLTPDIMVSAFKLKKTKKIYTRSKIELIEEANRAISVNGFEIDDLTEADWDKICCYRELVFARTSPEQKFKIVNEFKLREEIVAVTGDGVNDSPALKTASVGVAMGGGSEVAMESASLVLIDNNFSSLLAGIESGRLCFDNIKKVLMYLLPSGSWAELWPVLLSTFIGIPLPLNSALDLVICCVTDIFPSMALMFESPESSLMTRPPRNPKVERLVNVQMFAHVYLFIGSMQCVFSFLMYFMYFWNEIGVSFHDLVFMYGTLDSDPVIFPNNVTISQDNFTALSNSGTSVYFVTLVMLQCFGNVYASRTRFNSVFQQNPFWGPGKNLYIPAGCSISILVAVLFVYVPGLNSSFNTGPIPAKYWFIPIPFGFIIILMDELRKFAVRRMGPESFIAKISW
ncbi:hypothetical protein HK100_010313 [Physocladia obscura]|uniref:Cation-transporting P-type ATPase N-terminal domain-containing protein n=1 Tax=Physocladia obscura TaxID=109957 RepID=A0AAD5T8L9_9FUNG|nr:hypothetical protein HK100_010313 [Physocladia obscura]